MPLNIYLLGIPRLEIDNKVVEIDTRKATAILAYLALAEKRPSRDFLATFLWPDFDQSRAKAALRRTLSAMRRDVGKDFFEISREAVAFSPEAEIWVDVVAFQYKADSSSSAELETAVALYRDDFMAGFTLRDSLDFDEWQYYQGEQLRRTYSSVLEQLINHYQSSAEWDIAIRYARRWLALDSLHEAAHRKTMQLLAWAGKRTEAVRHYRECVRILEEELGVAPLPETTDLFHAIQENNLLPPAKSPQPLSVLSPEMGERPFANQIPLVGRVEALAVIGEGYDAVTESGRFVIIGGEAGIGKTRLAEEFLGLENGKGTRIVTARCYEGEQGLAFGPVVSALRQLLGLGGEHVLETYWQQEIGRLLPESLAADQPPSLPALDSPGAQSRFFSAISQSFAALLSSQRPGILYIDDLQWADQATLDWLIYFIRRLPELSIFILGCWRTPDVVQEATLRQMVSTGQRAKIGHFLELSRLNEEDVEHLLDLLNKSAVIASQLYAKSEGLPFFLNAYLTDLNGDEVWPESFRDLLYSRLDKVDQTGQQLLQTAAVIGRSFDFDTLRTASGRSDDEAVEAVENLLAHGLVIETAATSADLHYDFSHQALRDLVYEETSFARRRLLHRRVADSLSQQRKRPLEATAAQIGHHYYSAGQEGLAAEYFYQAGSYAKKLYANTEALHHFQTALALGHPATADLHEAIADLQKLNGRYGAALAAYEKAAALAETADLYRLEQKSGGVYHRQGDWERAFHHFFGRFGCTK